MTDKLPPNLLALFTPRPPLRFIPAHDHAPEDRHTSDITSVSHYLPALKDYVESDQYNPTESWLQRRDRVRDEKRKRFEKQFETYNPAEEAKAKGYGDPFRTLFVARLSYNTEMKDLEREFGRFGPIEKISLVTNTEASENAPAKKKQRGYAFVVFEREQDMKSAYKETDGIRIKDRRVLVDVERGRTVAGWKPRRLGGGLGGRGYTKSRPMGPSGANNNNFGGPPAGPGGFRGGFSGRGGGRGGGFGGRGGGGGFRGGYGRGGGFQNGAPDGAPSGPRGPRGYGGGGGSGRFEDRDGDRHRGSGSNREPVGPRQGGGGYRDRDRDGGYGGGRDAARDGGRDGARDGGRDEYRKRPHDGDSYDDQRHKRRY